MKSNGILMQRALFTLAFLFAPLFAFALELVMVEQIGCFYCRKWKTEIEPIYQKTDLATRAPLTIINISKVGKNYELARPVVFTPTFLLVEDGKELSRIEGYQSDDFFWGLTEEMINAAEGN